MAVSHTPNWVISGEVIKSTNALGLISENKRPRGLDDLLELKTQYTRMF